MADDRLLETIDDTAKRLSVSRSTVYELLRDSELQAVKIGRSRRITTESARRYVERLKGEAAGFGIVR
jgi:excisionase family DNA binding protein